MLCARALSQRDAVNCVKSLSIAICDATTAVVSALFSIVLFNKFSKVMKMEYVYKVMVHASDFGFYTSFRDAVSAFEELCSLYPGLVSLHRIVKKPFFD